MTPALRTSLRQALNKPLLSEADCDRAIRAVLEGVREPSEAMKAAGAMTDVPWEFCEAATGKVVSGPFALEISGPNKIIRAGEISAALHRAMIDALLSPETVGG